MADTHWFYDDGLHWTPPKDASFAQTAILAYMNAVAKVPTRYERNPQVSAERLREAAGLTAPK